MDTVKIIGSHLQRRWTNLRSKLLMASAKRVRKNMNRKAELGLKVRKERARQQADLSLWVVN